MLSKLIIILLTLLLSANYVEAKPLYVVSNHICASIIKELVGEKVDIHCLLQPGASPHALSLRPSDMYKIEAADAIIYVSEHLDPWINDIQAKTKISLIKLIPTDKLLLFENGHCHGKHEHEGHNHAEEDTQSDPSATGEVKSEKQDGQTFDYSKVDPHFWTDPVIVKDMLPGIIEELSKISPEIKGVIQSNGIVFKGRLLVLNKQIERYLNPHKGKPVFLYHPSFLYLLKRYSLKYVGSLELSPGREPTAKDIAKAIKIIQAHGIKAIFFEAQFPMKPVKTIKKEIGTNIYLLDPIGGVNQRDSYTQIILYNAKKFRSALKKY